MSWLFGLLLLVLWIIYICKGLVQLYARFRRSEVLLQNLPGLRLFLHPHSIFALLPRISSFNVGDQYILRYKGELFNRFRPGSHSSSDEDFSHPEGYDSESIPAPAVISMISFFPPSRSLLVSDPVTIKYITQDRQKFQKSPIFYKVLHGFGPHVAISEGEVFKRHRAAVRMGFNSDTIRMAWTEALRVVEDCFSELESKKITYPSSTDSSTSSTPSLLVSDIEVPSILQTTLKVSLFIILAAAFSQRPPWRDTEKDSIPGGHRLPFGLAMDGVLEGSMVKFVTPKWAYKLPIRRLRQVSLAYTEFELYIREYIAERRSNGNATTPSSSFPSTGSQPQQEDLLGALVKASGSVNQEEIRKSQEAETEKDTTNYEDCEDEFSTKQEEKERNKALSDEEVMGNIYIMLAAGHETTAHTTAFALTLLALYQEEQAKLYDHIRSIIPDGTEPDYDEHFSKLTLVQAAFLEALRLYPAVTAIPKRAMADTVLPTSSLSSYESNDVEGSITANIFIPKWTELLLNAVALHRNPRYWGRDADVFRPTRFIDDETTSYRWPREAFLGFSAGHRACLGQKYAMVEGTAIISMILQKYSIHLREDLDGSAEQRRKKGETFEAKVERVIKCKVFLTLCPSSKIGLIFRERKNSDKLQKDLH